jgi:hypothetical protein
MNALKCLLPIKPHLCERYVRLGRQELADWKRRAVGIPMMSSVADDLTEVQLVSSASGAFNIHSPRSEAASAIMAAKPVDICDPWTRSQHRATIQMSALAGAETTFAVRLEGEVDV